MLRGWANASRIADSVISLKVTRWVLAGSRPDRLGDMPGDGLALAIEVGGEVDHVRLPGGLLDRADLLLAVGDDLVDGREVVVHVHAELVLAELFGQVPDVTIRGEDRVVRAQIAFDRLRLGRRFDDHEVVRHRFRV